ncbi:MAG TPA: hypothetical protein DFI00_06660, partial [Rhodospirillaceae bacterium]|nr:hypothetical protein [Rhodospirillaceae bacterium]
MWPGRWLACSAAGFARLAGRGPSGAYLARTCLVGDMLSWAVLAGTIIALAAVLGVALGELACFSGLVIAAFGFRLRASAALWLHLGDRMALFV